jgi:hypothetical protein
LQKQSKEYHIQEMRKILAVMIKMIKWYSYFIHKPNIPSHFDSF